MERPARHGGKAARTVLILGNIVLMMAVIFFAVHYSAQVRAEQEQSARDTFCTTVETMKQLSVQYLGAEKSYADDWAAYIESRNMTLDEALEYLRAANTQQDRLAHIVDMSTYEAWSSYKRSDGDTVSVYQNFAASTLPSAELMIDTMQRMFAGRPAVLGKYKIYESQLTVVSVGTRVELANGDGTTKPYLLLRVIPVESMKKIWLFPVEYSRAEIGLITTGSDYVIQSAAMRSENFLEFIRSYNYANDYNGADVLLTELAQNSSGVLDYKDSRGQDCFWYYSALDGYEGLDILAYIPKSALYHSRDDWSMVFLISGALLLLAVLDTGYVMFINRRLRETAKLAEQASDAKTRFLSSMSHDIRTPLNAVLGMTELAQKRVNDAAYVQECLDNISVSGSHLLTLINDVLDISKVESGKTTLNNAPFALEELVDGLDSIIRAQAAEHKLNFTVDVHNIPQPYLVGDKLRLSQIYLNLLTNAVKYTQTGGEVRLEVMEKTVDTDKVELVCIVSDNGIGMSEEFQKNMYDSFARAADSRIDKTQGTGLGLAIAKRMVELMGGSIDCQSELSKGTTFTVRITLPAAVEESVPRVPVHVSAAGPGSLKGMCILIAEDNDLNWEIIRSMLEEYGIRADRAENGRLCVEMLEAAPAGTYEMVLMDVQMPEMNGYEAARAVRSSKRQDLRTIPIAAMTADAFAEDVQACLDAGMDAHLAKPVDIEKVIVTICQLREKNRR